MHESLDFGCILESIIAVMLPVPGPSSKICTGLEKSIPCSIFFVSPFELGQTAPVCLKSLKNCFRKKDLFIIIYSKDFQSENNSSF